jgi:uncharacterized protein (TIGR00251 family)
VSEPVVTAAEGKKKAVVVAVHAQPGAGKTELVGRHGDALKIRVAVPPERGRANEALGKLLAETFGVKPAAVSVISGETSRTKAFQVDGIDLETAEHLLRPALAGDGVPDTAARDR